MSKNKKTAIAHLPLYMWGQSGELDETNYNDCGQPVVWPFFFFNMSVSTNQNGMLLVLAAYITEVQRQSTCVCSVHNAV